MSKKYDQKLLDQVGEILTDWGKTTERPVTKDDRLDVKRLNDLETTKSMIKELVELGVKNQKQLIDMGFIPAGMILKF